MLALAALLVGVPLRANDTTAELATGGLRIARNAQVEMVSEDLSIAPDRIHVAYRFRNHAPSAVSVSVAFPLPDLAPPNGDDVAVPSDDPSDPFAFRLKVNGIAQPARLDSHAIVGGEDNTALLVALGVPLVPTSSKTAAALAALSPADKNRLVAAHVASADTGEDGRPTLARLVPNWTLRSAYYWTQVFPAGTDVAVEHDYRPSVGGSAQTGLGQPNWRTNRAYAHDAADFCPDADLLATIARARQQRHLDYSPFGEQRVDYVLHTGANWAGPIGRFHLTVDKGSPRNLVSLCMTGLSKTGATTFEAVRAGFTPSGDLRVLWLTPT